MSRARRQADRARGPDGPQPPAASSPTGADPSRESFYDYVQTSAWIGLVEYLLGQDWAMEQFVAETGVTLPQVRSGIETMIDKACGYDGNREFLRAFLPWVTRAHWGEDEVTPGIAGFLARIKEGAEDER